MVYNFTEGKILNKLIPFAIPIFLAMFLQSLYGAVDLAIVGQFGDKADISAVSVGSQIIMTFIMIVANLSMGTAILVGQKIGAGKKAEAGKVIGCGILVFAVIAVFMTLTTTFFSEAMCSAMSVPQEAFSKCVDYIQICGWGSVFFVAFNIFGGILRGVGDARTPLIAVAISTVINIIGDLILVAGFNQGAAGTAIATCFSQAISVLIALWIVKRKPLPFTLSRKDIRFHSEYTKKTLLLGAPVAIQGLLVNIAFLAIITIVNQIGLLASAGVGITQRLVGFLMLVPSTFSQVLATLVAQNVGAQKYDRAQEGLKVCIGISLLISLIIAYLGFFHGDLLLGLFSSDQEVISAGWEYLKSYALDVLMTSFMFCFVGYFNGYGKTGFVMLQGIIGAVVIRVPLSFIFAQIQPVSLFTVGLATPISTLVQNILCIIYLVWLNKKNKMNAVSLYSQT